MRRLEEGGHGRSCLGDAFYLARAAVSVLSKFPISNVDIARPVLGVDDHDSTGPEDDVIEVRPGSIGPPDVVQRSPPVPVECRESVRDLALALRAGGPSTNLLLSPAHRFERLGRSRACVLGTKPVQPQSVAQRLLLGSPSWLHPAPSMWLGAAGDGHPHLDEVTDLLVEHCWPGLRATRGLSLQCADLSPGALVCRCMPPTGRVGLRRRGQSASGLEVGPGIVVPSPGGLGVDHDLVFASRIGTPVDAAGVRRDSGPWSPRRVCHRKPGLLGPEAACDLPCCWWAILGSNQ